MSAGGNAMKEYAAVIERETDGRYSVYVPDLPGCASMGDTRREALANVREAIACYEEGLARLGRPLPRRRARVEIVRIKAA
jgi:predicted RNase H-like HicB family nuclease